MAAFEDHERHRSLAFVLIVDADYGGLSYALGAHQRVLDLNGREPVASDVEDVVDTAGYGVVTLLVALRAVLDVVDLLRHVGVVFLLVTLGVLPQGPELSGPGLVYGQRPACGVTFDPLLFLLVPKSREDAGERLGGATGLELGDAG